MGGMEITPTTSKRALVETAKAGGMWESTNELPSLPPACVVVLPAPA